MTAKLKAAALVATLLALAACNTVHGFGKDMTSVGDTVADAAQ